MGFEQVGRACEGEEDQDGVTGGVVEVDGVDGRSIYTTSYA